MAKREFDRDSVKLHMTLINANNKSTDETDNDNDGDFSAGPGNSSTDVSNNKNNQNLIHKKSFDARHILDKYAYYEFGQQLLTEIHLAIMKTQDVRNGFYKCTTSIQV